MRAVRDGTDHGRAVDARRPVDTRPGSGVFKGPGRLGAVWDPSPEGDAPEAYDVSLAGAWEGQVALPPSRVHETELSAGVYSLRVRARNACGVSPWTAVQTVAVP